MKRKILVVFVLLFSFVLRSINFSDNLQLIAACVSVSAIVVIYIFVKKYDPLWAKISIIFLAVSPWMIIFSRNPYELFQSVNLVASSREILQKYFSILSANNLFFSGEWTNQTKYLSYQGMMYFPDILFLAVGLIQLFSKKMNVIEKIAISSLFIFPLLSSVFLHSFLFSLLTGIALVLVSAKGFAVLVEKSKVFLFLLVFYLFFFIRFLDLYFFHI